jgi:hypothetical protein
VLEVSGSGGNDGDISFSWWVLGGCSSRRNDGDEETR